MRASCFRLLALWTALLPPAAAAQWPGEVEGRVVDVLTGRGVEAAAVTLGGLTPSALTDASGRFRLRAPSAGSHELVVERVGYAPERRTVRVDHGRTSHVVVELVPLALDVEGVTARVGPGERGAVRVRPGSAAAAGARTAADLLEGLPGVSVTGRGAGSARTVSIRGSAPDAVLVLVDGVPLNDPLTGEADLSLVPADAVTEVVVLPGARSARYGPRAQAGVVRIRTGGTVPGTRVEGSVGSLGRVGGGLDWTGEMADGSWSLVASGESIEGGFDFRRDPSVGGGTATRVNADFARVGIRAGLDVGVPGGSSRLRVAVERLERGLPGRSFAPSPDARQEERRAEVSATLTGVTSGIPLDLEVYGAWHRGRVRDPAPPAGPPYDDVARVLHAGARGVVRHPAPPGPFRELAVGGQVEHQGVEADALQGETGRGRTGLGAFVTAGTGTGAGGWPDVRGTARLDRDGLTGDAVFSHEVELAFGAGPLTARLAHRSAFSPPALADRWFRSGVGVEPNPDLRGERVPSEIEAGISATLPLGGWSVDASMAAYRADVRGMIVWTPDFRFVWSPRNVDVLRRGLDARLDAATSVAGGVLHLSSSWSLARVTYDRDGRRDLQLRYRPRHTGALEAAWNTRTHAFALRARYVGSRLPVPSDVNRLPGFWTLDVTATSGLELGGWRVEPTLRVERLRDVRDSMIFAFPEPGRTVGLELSVRRAPRLP